MKKLTLLLTIGLLMGACDKDNNDFAPETLNGIWTLDDVICYCAFDDSDFEDETLTINTENKTLSVAAAGRRAYFSDQGTYSFAFRNNIMEINGTDKKYRIELDNTNQRLTITFIDDREIADDEVTYIYKR